MDGIIGEMHPIEGPSTIDKTLQVANNKFHRCDQFLLWHTSFQDFLFSRPYGVLDEFCDGETSDQSCTDGLDHINKQL